MLRSKSDCLLSVLYKEAIRSIHPLCSLRSTPTWPFDSKPPTYEPMAHTDLRAASSHRLWASAHIYMLGNRKECEDSEYAFSDVWKGTGMVPGLISDFSIFVSRTDLEPQAHHWIWIWRNNWDIVTSLSYVKMRRINIGRRSKISLSGERGGPKSRKPRLLSARMIEPFLGRYEPWLISRQACGSGPCIKER